MHWILHLCRFVLGIGLLTTTLLSCTASQAAGTSEDELLPPTTIIMVRHAEKAYGDDPDLTPAGQERAQRLAFMLQNVDLDAIYSTDTRRTQQTAQPVAQAKGLKVRPYEMSDLETLARVIRFRHRGETVLVVGHSNTTPALATILAAPQEFPRFSELDYENLLIVTLTRQQGAKVIEMKF